MLLAGGYLIYGGGKLEGPGQISSGPRIRSTSSTTAQILFGDLHVHTTYSMDAFMRSLPLLGGEGAHPPADACDFARYCSGLDFFAYTDHAEALTPKHWEETKETARRCNAVSGDPQDPDLVAFVGWEWTQVGWVPNQHFGHKNVIFPDTEDAKLPKRPISARGLAANAFRGNAGLPIARVAMVPIQDFDRRQRYLDAGRFFMEAGGIGICAPGVDVRALPNDCFEVAPTPKELFAKLDAWGFDVLVIPHGTTWGFYTPPGYSYDKQLRAAHRDPQKQRLFEVYSGHGNSEEYRSFRAVQGKAQDQCPEPTDTYEPCCWRAGEIIRSRCDAPDSPACEARVKNARSVYAKAGTYAHLTVPGATLEDWKNCGQCTDCFTPSFNYRPRGSAQYVLAKGNFDDPKKPHHERMGLIASSDNHSARPGTGYKEFERRKMADPTGFESEQWRRRILGPKAAAVKEALEMTEARQKATPAFRLVDMERQASFFMTGGLVAVHAKGRDRASIWSALKQRQVYGTSGPRILLWFDLLDGETKHPMGAAVHRSANPSFEIRAAGAFEQKPGCPKMSLSPSKLERLCLGECYHPGDKRHRITRLEVIRIRPQVREDEPLETLIDDPWRKFDCEEGKPTCVARFEDPDFATSARDAVYYVRAIQAPTPAVNAGGLRCKGETCQPCYGGYQTPFDEDCLSPTEERAWSSPIFVRYRGAP